MRKLISLGLALALMLSIAPSSFAEQAQRLNKTNRLSMIEMIFFMAFLACYFSILYTNIG